MTAQEIVNEAMVLAGITDGNGETEGYFYMHKSHLSIVNAVLRDLSDRPQNLNSLTDCVCLPPQTLDAAIYGVAMWMCRQIGDVNQELFFAETYRDKRKCTACDDQKLDVIYRAYDDGWCC